MQKFFDKVNKHNEGQAQQLEVKAAVSKASAEELDECRKTRGCVQKEPFPKGCSAKTANTLALLRDAATAVNTTGKKEEEGFPMVLKAWGIKPPHWRHKKQQWEEEEILEHNDWCLC